VLERRLSSRLGSGRVLGARLSVYDNLLYGRGQPLSFTLSFGEIPWFDEEG